MNFLKDVRKLIGIRRDSNVTSAEVHWRDHAKLLVGKDNDNLKDLIFPLILGLSSLNAKSAIVAVGSSLYPKCAWEKVQKDLQDGYTGHIPTGYNDIDLLILPEREMKVGDLGDKIVTTLEDNEYEATKRYITDMGSSFYMPEGDEGGDEKRVCSYKHFGYGVFSVRTKLRNGRGVDLIVRAKETKESLGRCYPTREEVDNMPTRTAQEKIDEERANGKYFSVLHSVE